MKEIVSITGGRYFHIDYHYSQANDIILDLNSVKVDESISMKNLNFAMASLSMAALQAPAKEWSLKLYDITKDSWSFRNHGSYLSPGGLCAGFVTTCIGNLSSFAIVYHNKHSIGNTTLSDSALEYLIMLLHLTLINRFFAARFSCRC